MEWREDLDRLVVEGVARAQWIATGMHGPFRPNRIDSRCTSRSCSCWGNVWKVVSSARHQNAPARSKRCRQG